MNETIISLLSSKCTIISVGALLPGTISDRLLMQEKTSFLFAQNVIMASANDKILSMEFFSPGMLHTSRLNLMISRIQRNHYMCVSDVRQDIECLCVFVWRR